ncbi:MAG: DegV family EDD domain-containing protein [Ruminococcus sp.]|nr:DegV family EDD domain-containing protein [Ruminococcus sp.]
MSNIILVAETGSDITPELAKENGIYLVPMHVSMGSETLDDGTFPAEDVCAYYDRTGKVPTTSASTPYDFTKIFDEIHEQFPEKKILHLAYSAVTTCSYQNALLASEDRDYVKSVDTKHVSVGQAVVVLEAARFLKENPDVTIEEAAEEVRRIADNTQMCFIPKNLDYLRAGGRVSNATALVGNILNLHPCIEIIDGKLLAKKKYRGSTEKVISKLMNDYVEKHSLKKEHVYFIHSPGLGQEEKKAAEEAARSHGFEKMTWMKTGCVITCHGGPGAFGIVGFSGK